MKSVLAFIFIVSILVYGWEICVEIEPKEAREAGAVWRFADGLDVWHDSNAWVECETNECKVEYRSLDGWQSPNPWILSRPEQGNTMLQVQYEKCADTSALMDLQLIVTGNRLARTLHLALCVDGVDGYRSSEDVSTWIIYDNDAWLYCDDHSLIWDCRPLDKMTTWNLIVQGDDVVVSWNPEQLIEECEMQLQGEHEDINMRQCSSAELKAGEYVIKASMPNVSGQSYILQPGWNLLSCNFALFGAYQDILRGRGALSLDATACGYSRWNGQAGCFWIFSPVQDIIILKGVRHKASGAIDYGQSGWSMIGVDEASSLPGGDIAWEFVDGIYRPTTELVPGRGYWHWN